jgi:hypothetical protein
MIIFCERREDGIKGIILMNVYRRQKEEMDIIYKELKRCV